MYGMQIMKRDGGERHVDLAGGTQLHHGEEILVLGWRISGQRGILGRVDHAGGPLQERRRLLLESVYSENCAIVGYDGRVGDGVW